VILCAARWILLSWHKRRDRWRSFQLRARSAPVVVRSSSEGGALDGGHLLHRSRQPGELVVRYRADEASRRELTQLIDVEQECCGFVTWTVLDTDDELTLVVRGSPAELDALSAGG